MATVKIIATTKATVAKAVSKKLRTLKNDGFVVHSHEIISVKPGLGDRMNVNLKIVYDAPSHR